MDRRIRHISENIQRGSSPEENIPVLFNYLADHYQALAGVRLAMHYYTFYESYCDDEDTWSKEAINLISAVNKIIHDNLLDKRSGEDREKAVLKADTIRREIMNRMNILTAYTDVYQNYEYVLNRLEYRFDGAIEAFDEDEFAKNILRFIFDTEDNVIINEKIKDMIGQLPVRFTKQKYFEILKESLNTYLGTDGASFDTFLYMLRTSAMLYQGKEMESMYPELWNKKEILSHMEYHNITQENYETARNAVQTASIILETESSVYFGLQEMINEIYTILLCSSYSGMSDGVNDNAIQTALSIIYDINESFLLNKKEELSEVLLEKFHNLEGVQEELSVEIETMESALYFVNKNQRALTQSLMLDQLLNVLIRSQSLMSDSLFIELNETVNDCVVDEKLINKEEEALKNELTELFAGHDKMLNRAVIANTINKVPVFFKNHKEVMDYVRYSLGRCADQYEKAACFEIINDMMLQ